MIFHALYQIFIALSSMLIALILMFIALYLYLNASVKICYALYQVSIALYLMPYVAPDLKIILQPNNTHIAFAAANDISSLIQLKLAVTNEISLA
jgi:hypothetical protein